MSRVVVTGAAGFIGSHTVEAYARAGWDVVAIDDLSGGTSAYSLHDWWRGLDVDFRRLSVRMADIPRADLIVHLASPVGPVGVLRAAGTIAGRIIDDALAVADWARSCQAPLVFVSTSELYGPQLGPASEDAPCVTTPYASARQEYAVGKLAAEIALLNTPGLDVRIVRPFNIAGPRQRPGGGFVIPRWIEQHRAGGPITVYGTGEQRRAFCHVADFVDGLRRVEQYGRSRVRYNLGNPYNVRSLNELAAEFSEIAGATIAHVDPVALHGSGFVEAPDKVPVIDRAMDDLDWHPVIPTRAIIEDALAAA